MLAVPEVAHAADPLTRALAALATIAVAGAQIWNHRKGKSRDTGRKSELERLQESITTKLDRHQDRTEQKIDHLRETLTIRIDEVECRAEDAQRDATKALHASIGVDGDNGNRGQLRDLKQRFDEMEDRERRFGPADRRAVG